MSRCAFDVAERVASLSSAFFRRLVADRNMKQPRFVALAGAALILMLLTVSCSTLRTPRQGEAVVVPVFYATDRMPLMPLDQWQAKLRKKGSHFPYYGGEYDPSRLELGVCPISVPARLHRAGVVERPGWPSSAEDPAKHFSITALRPSEPEAFFAELSRGVTHSDCREVFIFVHGYNMTFASAALYTAQLAWDWGFRGVPILYSWPSDGTVLAYPKDEESARLSEAHLRVFLGEILAKSGATNVHLIAHSLGGRVLTDVLKSFAGEWNQPRFGEVILAAPDVNRIGFLQDVAQALPKVARRVTLYASSKDLAMESSKIFHQFPRAGDTGLSPVVCNGMDTIDASGVEADALGHSYLLRAPPVIADMEDVICHGLPPEQRHLKRLNAVNGQCCWKLENGVTSK